MPRKKEFSYQTEGDIFATRLQEVMKKRGENQTTLAAKITEQSCVIQRQSISQYMQGQSKPDTTRLTAICKALKVSADYLLGLSDTERKSPTLRAAVEYTGLSEAAIVTITNATGGYNHFWSDESDRLHDEEIFRDKDVNVFLGDTAVEALDELLTNDGDGFLDALAEIRLIASEIGDFWEEWKARKSGDPPLSLYDASQKEKELRFSLFNLTEEAKTSANDLYGYDEALEKIHEIIRAWETIKGQEAAHTTDEDAAEGTEYGKH